MRRKLFFFLERLQIPRAERLAIASLSITVIGALALNETIDRRVTSYEHDYEHLEELFKEKSKKVKKERAEHLQRFKPAPLTTRDTSTTETGIDLNRASLDELQELPGIGPALAERIIRWRADHGPFIEPDDLLQVQGIGPARLEEIKPRIVIESGNSP